jgi:hypothetical protein
VKTPSAKRKEEGRGGVLTPKRRAKDEFEFGL